MPGCGDATLGGRVPPGRGRRRQPPQGPDFLPLAEGPPAKKLPDNYPGPVGPNPCEHHALLPFRPGGLLRRPQERPAGGFPLRHRARAPRAMLPRVAEALAQSCRERGPIPQVEVLQLLGASPGGRHGQAVRGEQALQPVEDPGPVPLRGRQGAVPLTVICCRDTGDPHHAPPLPFPSHLAQEHREQLGHLEPIGLRPPLAALHLNT